jgi:hypothetical protein
MSLASTAFPWTNDDAANKKKTPTMNRKTVKAKPQTEFTSASIDEYTIFDTKEVQQQADERTDKVTEIINQMSSVSVDNDGSKLADFTPPPNPAVQQKKPFETNLGVPFQMPPSQDKPSSTAYSNQPISPFQRSAMGPTPTPTNYQQAYIPQTNQTFMTQSAKPYYANMGIGASDGKMMEKINYMIHMLENMESEKTANVMEEFVLYSFTGIFIIFVLDSFLKTGKYVR